VAEATEKKAAGAIGSGLAARMERAEAAKKGKKKSAAELQREVRDLSKPKADPPPLQMRKIYIRVGAVVGVLGVVSLIVPPPYGLYTKIAFGVVLVVAVGVLVWLDRYVKKTQALSAILRGADTDDGRKEALKAISEQFKKGDTQALLARAQLEMQEDPRKAQATLESIDLDKQLAPVAGQVRAMRAMIHLTHGETAEAKKLVEDLELGKQQEPKTRVMFATVAGEAWARTGQAQKALDTLELFNPDDAENEEPRGHERAAPRHVRGPEEDPPAARERGEEPRAEARRRAPPEDDAPEDVSVARALRAALGGWCSS
jgi:hypothetical protein